MAEVTLEALQALLLQVVTEQRTMRGELRDMRAVVLQTVDATNRLGRRIEELKDDLELMLKAELMGRFGHFEDQMEARLDRMAERMAALEAKGQG